jgi:hypothetical protein
MSSSVIDEPRVTGQPDGHEPAGHERIPRPRRPFVPIALALLGLVAILLAAALYLGRSLRSPIGVEPAPTVAAMTQPTAQVRETAPPTAQPAPVVQPTVAPTTVPTTEAVPAVAAGIGTAPPVDGASAIATAAAPATQELLSPLHKEITDAYLRYWNVRARAYYDLDPSRLKEVVAGAELARDEEDIQKLRAQGLAADTDVDLNFRILEATPDEATVYDEYVNRSLHLDAVTKQPIPTKEAPKVLRISFQMKKIDGVWKVVDVARHE